MKIFSRWLVSLACIIPPPLLPSLGRIIIGLPDPAPPPLEPPAPTTAPPPPHTPPSPHSSIEVVSHVPWPEDRAVAFPLIAPALVDPRWSLEEIAARDHFDRGPFAYHPNRPPRHRC